jgi:hypothetical protein
MKETRSEWKYKSGIGYRMKDRLTVSVEPELRSWTGSPVIKLHEKWGASSLDVISFSSKVPWLHVLKVMVTEAPANWQQTTVSVQSQAHRITLLLLLLHIPFC